MLKDYVPGSFFGRANKLSWEAAKARTKRARTPKSLRVSCSKMRGRLH